MSREHDVVTLSGAEYDALLSEAEEAVRLREELAALTARAEAAEAALLDAQKRLRGAGMLGGDNDPVNAALQGRDRDG